MSKEYIVKLEGTYSGHKFRFDDYEKAAAFIKTAIDHTDYDPAKAEIEAINDETEADE